MGTTTAVSEALRELELALLPPRTGASVGNWRWSVRQRLTALRDALRAETVTAEGDGWFSPHTGAMVRERSELLARLAAVSATVLDRPDLQALRMDLRRLAHEVSRHVQHVEDVARERVELERDGEQ